MTHDMYCSLQGVESEMCPSFIEAMKAGEPVKIVSDPTTLADGLNVPKVRIWLSYTVYGYLSTLYWTGIVNWT